MLRLQCITTDISLCKKLKLNSRKLSGLKDITVNGCMHNV